MAKNKTLHPEAAKRMEAMKKDFEATLPPTPTPDRSNKKVLVEEAVKALGGNPDLDDLEKYLKERYDVALSRGMLSSYKSQARKDIAARGETLEEEEADEEETDTEEEEFNGGVRVSDLEFLKDILERVPADEVKRLIDLLG